MFTADELRQVKIFACLEETERARLARTIADVRLKPGEWFIREGEPACFFVVFEGQLRLVIDVDGKPTEFAGFEANGGDFLGEVALLVGTPFFGSARAMISCRIARLDKQQFFHLIRDSKQARAMILQSFGERILRIQERTLSLQASRVFIFGRNKDTDCHEIRAFL
ncbi:MAG TPA: cyclic nucleotide-binding domain-containing protein, partial [Verrucomicrobiae bacterium]|nr:cyclic nucleotide-binding domain-containing protein [Verrucomicrobiae bacterium]